MKMQIHGAVNDEMAKYLSEALSAAVAAAGRWGELRASAGMEEVTEQEASAFVAGFLNACYAFRLAASNAQERQRGEMVEEQVRSGKAQGAMDDALRKIMGGKYGNKH